jgi:hypothetical protein
VLGEAHIESRNQASVKHVKGLMLLSESSGKPPSFMARSFLGINTECFHPGFDLDFRGKVLSSELAR